MQEWIAFKDLIVASGGVDRDALHVFAAVAGQIAVAVLLRRPLSSLLPWLAVLVIELGNEAATALADGRIKDWERAASLRDLLLVMALPTLLFILCRFAPRLVAAAPPPAKRPRLLFPVGQRREDEVIDAEFEEVAEPDQESVRTAP